MRPGGRCFCSRCFCVRCFCGLLSPFLVGGLILCAIVSDDALVLAHARQRSVQWEVHNRLMTVVWLSSRSASCRVRNTKRLFELHGSCRKGRARRFCFGTMALVHCSQFMNSDNATS